MVGLVGLCAAMRGEWERMREWGRTAFLNSSDARFTDFAVDFVNDL